MPDARSILYLHALTGLHPGAGTSMGLVDLPVQRERHTQWPLIPGSTLKGVLRDACRTTGQEAKIQAAFGPEHIEAADDAHAGALSVTDARLLAFPVRSLKGVFAWVTCPAALERYNRDLDIVGLNQLPAFPRPARDTIAASAVLTVEDRVVLEEYEFRVDPALKDTRAAVATRLSQAVSDKDTRARVQTNLAVLHDDDFTHFVRHATEVIARVGLDHVRKTVKRGALFYQEFLPPECLFYALLLTARSRGGTTQTPAEVLQFVKQSVPKVLQIGGDETIGKGLCALRIRGDED